MAQDVSNSKNFSFPNMLTKFGGYVSSYDKTKLEEGMMVQGSQNVYKNIAGNLSVRPGQKRRGAADATLSATSSEYVWNTSGGKTRTMAVANSTLYAIIDDVWYSLQTGLTKTRYVFDKWFDNSQKKDKLLFVNGTSNMYAWSGGFSAIASANNTVGAVAVLSATPTNAGSGYVVGDVLTISTGGTGATATVTAVGTGTITGITVTNGGGNYSVGDRLQLVNGDFGTGAIITVATVGANGAIATVTITSGGINYSTKDVNVSGGTGTNALLTISSVSTSGSITQISLTTPGINYTTGTGKATTGGTGTGATLNIVSIATGQVLKSDTTSSFLNDGFSTAGSFTNAGTTYTYQYQVGNYLVGVTPDPSGIVAGSNAIQTVVTTTNCPALGFNCDFIRVVKNRVYCGSYDSRVIWISSNSDYTNYAPPSTTTPIIQGSPNFVNLDGNARGIGVRQDAAHIGYGTGSWLSVTFPTYNGTTSGTSSTVYETIQVDVKPVEKLAAPLAHEFIDSTGDNIIYLSQDQQLRSFGSFNQSFNTAYPCLSQAIYTELLEQDFTGGGLRCIGDFTYITLPNSGKVYLYQVRKDVDPNGIVTAERVWHSPFIWNVTRIDNLNGEVIGFSNANPQIYDLWDTGQWYDDSPSDEQLPYTSILAYAYRTGGKREYNYEFDKLFTEGYLTDGTLLYSTINYNYDGSTQQLTVPINSVNNPAKQFHQNALSIGDSSLGMQPLGATSTDGTSLMAKFKNIKSLPLINMFEYQIIYYSDTTNAQWEILATGTNSRVVENQPTYILTKST